MISNYLVTLLIAVVLVTFGASSLQFATRSQVLSGSAVDEVLQLEFTVPADGTRYYKITPAISQFLEAHIGFHTDGPPRVVAAKVEITPKNVSWTENRRTITATGAALLARLQWDTPADSANGAHGSIYLDFPEVPGLEGKPVSFHSGGYQKDDAGRYVIREVTTYRTPFFLSLGRFAFALSVGLPFGIILHSIVWAFVLKRERRSRLAGLPPQGPGLPRTFYPSPIAEWGVWLSVLGIGAFVPTLFAGVSIANGFMSSTLRSLSYIILAIAVAIAFTLARLNGKSLLTVRVDTIGISYARGRADLQWLTAAWNEIRQLTQKSRTHRGRTWYWVEIEFNDNRKKLKITQSIEEYPALRDILLSVFPKRAAAFNPSS